MDEPRSSNQEPLIRFIVACPRSGSTLLMRIFAESTVCVFTSRLILMGNTGSRKTSSPDYSIIEKLSHRNVFVSAKNLGKRFLICKEELGNNCQKGECLYDVCPDSAANALVRPIFLIRDPIQVFDSWKNKPLGLFTTVKASSSVESNVPYHDLLSDKEKDEIQKRVGSLYLPCWQNDVLRLRAILAEKTWIGFDLDDTLHEFHRSSEKAINKTLEKIFQRYGTPMFALKGEYSRVLKAKTANAFSDGKTSFDYRRERFASILTHFSMPQDELFMTELLDSYESTLMASLELKCGALDLLFMVKDMGKKIVVITEGPQDAQERTIQGLGVGRYIDFLATTNYFGEVKTGGLFLKVLEHLSVSPSDMAYIGDNEERDMKPAMAEGIFSIHLAEMKHVSLNTMPPQINTLSKLQYILSDDRRS
ncbi:MAG: hypothetical protein ASARMPRED_006038 [Alectoria sarmentosa]|nr:MAG: hypothetical protein ASARMPRED_006038 [Alectoria sarmentosa]